MTFMEYVNKKRLITREPNRLFIEREEDNIEWLGEEKNTRNTACTGLSF